MSSDVAVTLHMMTAENFELLNTRCAVPSTRGKPTIMLVMRDASGPVEGVSIKTTPDADAFCYTENGVPSTRTATSPDGIAFGFGADYGATIIVAEKSGAHFGSATIRLHPDALNVTEIAASP